MMVISQKSKLKGQKKLNNQICFYQGNTDYQPRMMD